MTPHELATKIAATFGVPLDDILHGRGGYDRRVRAMIRAEIILEVWYEFRDNESSEWFESVNIDLAAARKIINSRNDQIDDIKQRIRSIVRLLSKGFAVPPPMVSLVQYALI